MRYSINRIYAQHACNHKNNCDLLQTAGSSSAPSGQSGSPSQCHILGIHLPLEHSNSVSLHSWVSETFMRESRDLKFASIGRINAHASCNNRMHVHRNTRKGRVELPSSSCMIARWNRLTHLRIQNYMRIVPRCTRKNFGILQAEFFADDLIRVYILKWLKL